MNWGAAILCCWPGLPGLWFRGRWTSLILAVAFAILLNLAIIASFIWTGVFEDDAFPSMAWSVLLLIWFASTVIARRNLPDVMSLTRDESVIATDSESAETLDALFIEARTEYLRGNWSEAQRLLQSQLKRYPRDIESRLLLATLFRHTRQFDEAVNQLSQIEKYDPAVNWKHEIARERELLRLVHEFESTEHDPAANLDNNNDGIIRKRRRANTSTRLPVETDTIQN